MSNWFGKGGDETTTSAVANELPEFYKPYLEDILARAQYETSQPYQPYPGQQLAYFTPMEQEAMARFGELGVSGTQPELALAAQSAGQWLGGWSPGIAQPITSSYTPTPMGSFGYNPSSYSSGYKPSVIGAADDYVAGQLGPEAFYNAAALGPEAYYSAAALGPNAYYTAGQIDPGANYVAGQREVGFEPGTLNDAAVISSYMSPYYQNVVDVAKTEAARQADVRNAEYGLDAAGSGSLGGYREAIIRAENERNLMQEMSDIQTLGSQSAYLQALQSMEADRQAQAQLEAFGQSQFGMNEAARQQQAALIYQGYGLEQAALQAQAGLAQSGYGLEQGALQAQAGLAQSGYGLEQGALQSQAGLYQQGFGLNQGALQAQAGLAQSGFALEDASRQAAEGFAQGAFGLSDQSQQFNAMLGLQSYQAYEQAKQAAASMGLSAQEIEQAGRIAQNNAMLGIGGLNLSAAGMLGGFASQQQQMEMERLNAMLGVGGMERGLYQQGLDIGYNNYMNQLYWPQQNLSLYGNLLYGQPIQPNQNSTVTQPGASNWENAIGTGLTAYALWQLGQGG